MINNLIRIVSNAGMTNTVYYSFHVLTIISVLIAAIFYGKRLGIDTKTAILVVVIIYPLMDFWKRVLYWMESGFTNFGGENNVRIFVYVPLLGFLVAKLLRIEWKKMCDYLAPLVVLTQGVGHFGCVFSGCCGGYPANYGLYNITTGLYHFPIQPIEAITALLITAYLLASARKRKYIPDGKQYMIMLVMFGFTRFIWEFFRDNQKLVLGCSNLAFHALFMCIVGIVVLIVVRNSEKKKASLTAK